MGLIEFLEFGRGDALAWRVPRNPDNNDDQETYVSEKGTRSISPLAPQCKDLHFGIRARVAPRKALWSPYRIDAGHAFVKLDHTGPCYSIALSEACIRQGPDRAVSLKSTIIGVWDPRAKATTAETLQQKAPYLAGWVSCCPHVRS